jgi:serine protease AprX
MLGSRRWRILTGVGAVTPVAASAGRPAQRTAVVALAGTRPVTVSGVRVLATLRYVHSELVRGTPAALARLAAAPGVRGVWGDARYGLTSSRGGGHHGPSVYAWQGLAAPAGRAGAGHGVNVALIDSGLTDTPALNRSSGRITDGVDVSQLAAGGSAQTSGTFPDGYGHGTFLASLVAGGPAPGSNGNGLGVAPGARIVVVKVADAQGTTSLSEVLAGLDWVAAHARAIKVVALALAQTAPTWPQYGADPLSAGIEHVAADGVLPIVAAGNTPGQVGDPGDDYAAVTIGAADLTGNGARVADFSGYGRVAGVTKPDFVASGVGVLGEMPPGDTIATANPQGRQPSGLFRGSGTSMSTAVAAGVAALFFSAHPNATLLQAKAALRFAARPMHAATGAGAGLAAVANTVLTGKQVTKWSNQAGFNASSWNANAWQQGDWENWLANAWSGPAWNASTWDASTWDSSTWSSSTWSDRQWTASTWDQQSWTASTWGAHTWDAHTWSDEAWGG